MKRIPTLPIAEIIILSILILIGIGVSDFIQNINRTRQPDFSNINTEHMTPEELTEFSEKIERLRTKFHSEEKLKGY